LHDRIILQRGEVFVNKSSLNKRWRTPKEQPKMDNPEKLAMATYGTQEKDEKNKNTTQMRSCNCFLYVIKLSTLSYI
jgi:hypothetical protein